ncbi:MAG: hypothetical protein KJ687_04060 [Proteobacteria bacterium]|nr:hypothetical protein [Pseudomonadota bacterium]
MGCINGKRTVAIIWCLTFDELFPNKPLMKLNGAPAFTYTVKAVQKSQAFDHCYIFTDSKDVVVRCKDLGIKTILETPTVSSRINYNRNNADQRDKYWKTIGEVLMREIGAINIGCGNTQEQKVMSQVADLYLVADMRHCLVRPATYRRMLIKAAERQDYGNIVPVYFNTSPVFMQMQDGALFPLTTFREFYTSHTDVMETYSALWGIRVSNCYPPAINKLQIFPFLILPEESPSLFRKEDIVLISAYLMGRPDHFDRDIQG